MEVHVIKSFKNIPNTTGCKGVPIIAAIVADMIIEKRNDMRCGDIEMNIILGKMPQKFFLISN